MAAAPGNYAASFTPQDTTLFWSSEPAGNYTFGFKLVVEVGEYLLAIWHSLDVNQTVIWWADFGDINPSNTIKQGAILNYSRSHGPVQLYDSATSSLIWRSGNFSTATSLQFLDTGNLRLLQENSTAALWESFNDRRDSLMLTGLEASSFTNKPVVLQSRRNQTSYAKGRFHMATYNRFDIHLFGLDKLNKQYVYMKDYNVSLNISGNVVSVGNQLDGSAYNVNQNPGLQRLSLDYDANLRVYQWSPSKMTWVEVWELIQDSSLACRAQSPCGPFGLCNIDSANTIHCSCPSGYTPISSEDPSSGCNSTRIPSGCGQRNAGHNTTIVEIQHSDYYYNDLTWFSNIYDIEECKNSCLSNCACIAATYNSGIYMCFLKGNSSMGYLENGLSSTSGSSTLLMKLLQLPDVANVPPPVKKGRQMVPITVVVALAVLTLAAGIGAVFWRWQRRTNWWCPGVKQDNEAWDAGPRRFSYQELVEVTNNFSDVLGEGGFGAVFKGWVRDEKGEFAAANEQGLVVVAVKVLKLGAGKRGIENIAVRQFRAEVGTLSNIHHINLVNLLGYCISGPDGEKRLLVYEYMENGSLDRYLSPNHMRQPLPWSLRFSIAVGTARGIAYLHHDCHPRILHCDIKPQNVLLDEHFTPKVADFGLAGYVGKPDQSHLTVSGMRGTRGYMAPDWLKSDAITPKADVYSFGMLLLELVHGLNTVTDENKSLVAWALQCVACESLIPDHELLESDDHDGPPSENVAIEGHTVGMALQPTHTTEQREGALEEQLRCLRVALWCVQQVPARRPSMLQVLQLLEGIRNIEDPPDPAATNINFQLLNFKSGSTHNVISYSVLSAR